MTVDVGKMEPEDDDGLPSNRLTRREIKELRAMLEADRRARWAWSTGRIWATWITGSLVAVYGLWDTVEKLLKKITG
jgi:hypothetical protein